MGIFDRTPAPAAPTSQPASTPAAANGFPAADFDPFAKIGEEAKGGFDRFPYLNTLRGNHVVCVDRISSKRLESGIVGYFIDGHAVHSDTLTPGSPWTEAQFSDKKGWLGRIARFLMAAARVTEKDIDANGTRDSYSPAQPFRGTLLAVQVVADSKKPEFNNVNWRALNDAELKAYATAERALNPNWTPAPLQAPLFQ